MDTTDKVLEIPVVEGLEFDDATHTYRLCDPGASEQGKIRWYQRENDG